MAAFDGYLLVCVVLTTLVVVSYGRELSTSDRISQIVEGRLSKSKGRKDSRSASGGGGQPLTQKPENKVTKGIDSYAQQRAKALKLRANHRSVKEGIRRIG